MPKRKVNRKVYKKNNKKEKTLSFLWYVGIFCLFFIFCSLAIFIYFAKDLPRPEKFTEKTFIESTKIYDRTGEVLLYEMYGEEKREIISLDKVPEHLIQAILTAEDINFYNHIGIDFRGIGRSVLINLKIKGLEVGGSTISQQLIRSSLLTTEKTIKRKLREIVLTLELERRYSKDQILELYLNQIPFGLNAYGVQAASLVYFQKPVSEISIPESAVLAALIRRPSYLSPYGENLEELLEIKDNIISRMAIEGFIQKEDVETLQKEEIDFSKSQQLIQAPHFVMYVRDYLEEKYGEDFLREKGLKVYTTLDWQLQSIAEEAVEKQAETNKGRRAYNAALTAIDPLTGEILAMVGSADFFGDPLPKGCSPGENCLFEPYPNVAIRDRQPGSAFKPIVYALAFQKGYSDKTVVVDEATNFGTASNPYTPQNYDGLFRGPVTLREALGQSLNIPSIKVLKELAGLEDGLDFAKKLGINSFTRPASFYGLPLVLGGGEVKLLELTSAYGVFATEGLKAPPMSILKIIDPDGRIIEENENSLIRVLDEKSAQLINDVLSDNAARTPIFGANSLMYFPNQKISVKTGTTDNFRDGWIVGYTSLTFKQKPLSVGVWVGNNDNTPMINAPGISVAGPVWRFFIEKIQTNYFNLF